MSFFHPKSGRDWRAMGAYTAFPVRVFIYTRLALAEEREVATRFGPTSPPDRLGPWHTLHTNREVIGR